MNSELLISIVNQVIYVPIRHHYKCRAIITYVVSALQISSFLTNKANFQKVKLNVNKEMAREYEKRTLGQSGKNKANSKPNKANLLNAQMNVTKVLTKDYENKPRLRAKAKQTQYKPNSNPIKPNTCPPSVWRVKRYRAKMGHHELKYIDMLGQLTLNLTKNSNSALNNDKEKESAAERTK